MPTTKGPRVTVTFDPEPAELARRGRRVAGELFSLFLGDLEDKLFPQLLEKLIQQRTKFGKDTDYNGHDGIYIPERDGGEDRGVAERAAMRGQGVLRMAQNRRGGNGSGTGSSVVWWGRATSDFGGSAKNHRPPRGASRGRLRPRFRDELPTISSDARVRSPRARASLVRVLPSVGSHSQPGGSGRSFTGCGTCRGQPGPDVVLLDDGNAQAVEFFTPYKRKNAGPQSRRNSRSFASPRDAKTILQT